MCIRDVSAKRRGRAIKCLAAALIAIATNAKAAVPQFAIYGDGTGSFARTDEVRLAPEGQILLGLITVWASDQMQDLMDVRPIFGAPGTTAEPPTPQEPQPPRRAPTTIRQVRSIAPAGFAVGGLSMRRSSRGAAFRVHYAKLSPDRTTILPDGGIDDDWFGTPALMPSESTTQPTISFKTHELRPAISGQPIVGLLSSPKRYMEQMCFVGTGNAIEIRPGPTCPWNLREVLAQCGAMTKDLKSLDNGRLQRMMTPPVKSPQAIAAAVELATRCLQRGESTDLAEALRLFKVVEKSKSPSALRVLACLQAAGVGTKPDVAAAAETAVELANEIDTVAIEFVRDTDATLLWRVAKKAKDAKAANELPIGSVFQLQGRIGEDAGVGAWTLRGKELDGPAEPKLAFERGVRFGPIRRGQYLEVLGRTLGHGFAEAFDVHRPEPVYTFKWKLEAAPSNNNDTDTYRVTIDVKNTGMQPIRKITFALSTVAPDGQITRDREVEIESLPPNKAGRGSSDVYKFYGVGGQRVPNVVVKVKSIDW